MYILLYPYKNIYCEYRRRCVLVLDIDIDIDLHKTFTKLILAFLYCLAELNCSLTRIF